MMRVTIEVVPFGVEADKHTIRELNIWNTGNDVTGDGLIEYRYSERPVEEIQNWLPDERADRSDGYVLHYRDHGAESLVRKVLADFEGVH